MYLYFFQLQAFGSGAALGSLWGNKPNPINYLKKKNPVVSWTTAATSFQPTTRFLLQVLDCAGEFGWQLERAGLSGDAVGLPTRGTSGSFSSLDPGRLVGKAPGVRKPLTSAGTLLEKQQGSAVMS